MEDSSIGIIGILFYLAFAVLMIVSYWKVYEKAGQPGWACIVPFYNIYIQLKIAGKPGWWMLLFFIPLVNFVIIIMMSIEIAKRFGKSDGFGIGLTFLSFIFYPILAFGDATYQGIAVDNPDVIDSNVL